MAVLQSSLPFAPWMDARTLRLPGVQPADAGDWLRRDDAFAGQMAERDRLIAVHPGLVHALRPEARTAANELYAMVLGCLGPGYVVRADAVTRPDGVVVPLDAGQPLLTLGRLVQEDLCLLQDNGTEHVLTGAILCFPASWTLAEKIGRPMTAIHAPVHEYEPRVATSVQRMMRAVQPGAVLWRANFNVYDNPALFHPRSEADPRAPSVTRGYVRSERQTFLRLPQTGAVVFGIHTYVVAMAGLTGPEQEGLRAAGK